MTESRSLCDVPLPLRGLGVEIELDAGGLNSGEIGRYGVMSPRCAEAEFRAQLASVDLGGLVLAVGRTAPLLVRHEPGGSRLMQLCFAGSGAFLAGPVEHAIVPRSAFLPSVDGGSAEYGFAAGLAFAVDAVRLGQVMATMLGESFSSLCSALLVLSAADSKPLFTLFAHVDSLLRQGRFLPVSMGLCDPVYRLIALAQIRQAGLIDQLEWRSRGARYYAGGMDELVDWVRLHASESISMTELEEKSGYSSRYLQLWFRQKFDCSPMRFVRRQRLSSAMQRLSTPLSGDSVAIIARECGYHHLSNFSVDFQKEFGVKPSLVLRRSRQRRRGQDQEPG